MKKLIKEPLLHFLAIGAMIFAFQAWRSQGKPSESAKPRIEITAGTIAWLSEGFGRTWHRAPDEGELRGLVQDHLREEMLYREALALGLERNDTIVRRRMAQKMEFLTEDIAAATPADDAALRAYFQANAARYATPGKTSFHHVYFSREKRGERLDADARRALDALSAGASADTLGDPYLGTITYSQVDPKTVTADLGGEFANALAAMSTGSWQGPVKSTYGLHLVQVTERSAPEPVTFEAARDTVAKDLADERRRNANGEFVENLRERYEIVIDEAAIQKSLATPKHTAQR